MRSATFLSVVIPTYNAAQWVGQTLDSWAQQTVRDFEVIVVDDESEDATVEVVNSFASRLDLRVIRLHHSGAPAYPCNVGIKEARGEIIVHCDGDDLATPDRLEWIRRAWDSAGRRDCLMISDFSEVDTVGIVTQNDVLADYPALQRVKVEPLNEGVVLIPSDAAFGALLEGNFIRPCSVATPKKVLDSIGGFNEALRNGQDYDLYMRVARDCPLVWMQRVLGLYRKRPGSISSRSAIQLGPSRIAVLNRVLGLRITPAQAKTVRRRIAVNFEAIGYQYGNQGQVRQSLDAYWNAFKQQPNRTQLRGMAASIAKALMRRPFGSR